MLLASIQQARAENCKENIKIDTVLINFTAGANDPYTWGIWYHMDNVSRDYTWVESDLHLDWPGGWELFEEALNAFSHHDKVTLSMAGTTCGGRYGSYFNAIHFSRW
jgi:hypothetical protein